MVMEDTNFNPYEELNRTRKAARIAVAVIRHSDVTELPDTPQVNNQLRAIAVRIGENAPSEDTLAVVRAIVNGTPFR